MADPIIKRWGPLELAKKSIDPTDASLSALDKEELIKLVTIDCYPPPKATTQYNKPQRVVPLAQPRSLQQSEKTHLTNIKDLFGGAPSTLKGIQTAIESKLGFDAKLVSYASKKYLALQTLTPCFTNDIYVRLRYEISEVKISAKQAVTLGADQFPAGDEIATYRIRELKDYRFESHLTWNKKCCEREPAETPTPSATDYYLAHSEASIEEVIETGKRIKLTPRKKQFKVEEEKWEFGLDLGYDRDKWGLDLDWRKYLEDD